MSGTGIDPDVEARLDRLEAESERRRRQLSDMMQHLPAEVSRRDVVRDSVADLGAGSVARVMRRAARTVAEIPRRLVRRVRGS